MATRSRTLEFVQLRTTFLARQQQRNLNTSEKEGLMSNQETGAVVVELSVLPPKWQVNIHLYSCFADVFPSRVDTVEEVSV